MPRRPTHIAALASILLLAGCAQEVLSAEPAPGKLRPGESVFVDDGRCPPGQVAQVTSGNNVGKLAGVTTRNSQCVPRPR